MKGYGFTGKVRNCIHQFSDRKVFSAPMIGGILGEPNAARVQTVFRDLLRRGEIVKIEPGRYRHTGGQAELWCKPAEAKPRILRAMHISQRFTAREIALLADAGKNFTYKLIRKLVAAGELVKLGKTDNLNRQKEVVYRVKDRDEFYLKHLISRKDREKDGDGKR